MIKYTYSTLFLFPLLEIDAGLFSISKYVNGNFIPSRLINAYMGHEGMNIPENCICVAYFNFGDVNQRGFQDTLEGLPGFQFSYDILNGNVGVSVFEIPKRHQLAYYHFKQGKYSKYPTDSRLACVSFPWKESSMSTFLSEVFTKASNRREAIEAKIGQSLSFEDEVWSIYTPHKEFINPFIIKSLELVVKANEILWSKPLVSKIFLGEDNDSGMDENFDSTIA